MGEYSEERLPVYHSPIVTVEQPARWLIKDFGKRSKHYALSLFPITGWILKYNMTWFWSDLIAGITVGVIGVPQSMSYAQVAGLPVQYGLYSSFIGEFLYMIFATSKDVSIGPVAVMSMETFNAVHRVLAKLPHLSQADAPAIASTLSLLCGGITFGFGILRLGFLLEYISMPCVLGFMSGSAFTIAVGQVPTLMGLKKYIDGSPAAYLVMIETLKNLKHTNLDAAFGLVSLFVLTVMKYGCDFLAKRDPRRRRIWFFLGTLRAAFLIIFTTLISWGICKSHRASGNFPISIVKTVPRGLQHVGVNPVSREVASALAPELPISTVVLLLEHIAISRSFGRINEYRVNPNQELVAIGAANMVGHFFEAYPNTGSFSRSALKSKCGVRTPFANLWTGVCVLVAVYALTDAFFWISKAALAAVIIHAVVDLVASWRSTYKFWLISPVECIIFLVDIILCVFVNLEAGIYFSVAASLVYLLLRQTFPWGQFLGKVQFRTVRNPKYDVVEEEETDEVSYSTDDTYAFKGNNGEDDKMKTEREQPGNETSIIADATDSGVTHSSSRLEEILPVKSVDSKLMDKPWLHQSRGNVFSMEMPRPSELRTKWWPLSHDNINPSIKVVPPPPGIFVYRFREALTYQNASYQSNRVTTYIRKHTKRNLAPDQLKKMKLGDRPWNDGLPRNLHTSADVEDNRPVLRALVFDMSCSPHVDLTAANALYDLHQELTKYACQPVEIHFAGILSEWSQRALVYAGFGGRDERERPASTAAEISVAPDLSVADQNNSSLDEEKSLQSTSLGSINPSKLPITDSGKVYFHFDIPDLE